MCIFCKIAAKEIPAKIVYEDENTIAFLDVNPRSRGHTLVIPKKHYETFEKLPDEIAVNLIKSVKKVVEILNVLNPDGYNILNNNGKIAGQEVPHVHFHVIPRYNNEKNEVIKFSEIVDVDLDKVMNELSD